MRNLQEGYKHNGILSFHEFLLKLPGELSELQKLLVRSINRFGAAIADDRIHVRVAGIFTVLESLLLLSNNSHVIENVCKYTSKIVFKEKGD